MHKVVIPAAVAATDSDVGFVLQAGLAQPGTQVDNAGDHPVTAGIDLLVAIKTLRCCTDGDDFAIGNIHIGIGIQLVGGINNAAVADD